MFFRYWCIFYFATLKTRIYIIFYIFWFIIDVNAHLFFENWFNKQKQIVYGLY